MATDKTTPETVLGLAFGGRRGPDAAWLREFLAGTRRQLK